MLQIIVAHCYYLPSIGYTFYTGTSDNLEVEAVSEAASTHSVSSSIELEDQNDNLSDMLSLVISMHTKLEC